MKRVGVFLVAGILVVCLPGCGGGGGGSPEVVKGGGELMSYRYNSRGYTTSSFTITGSVVNVGDAAAENVRLSIGITSNDSKVCGEDVVLGTLAEGERREFSYTIPESSCGSIKRSTLDWHYTIYFD